MFDEAHKKPIPPYPSKIGIITADTGAAVADMKNILTRRFPFASVIIYPSLVQGAGAAEELCRGVRFFNRFHPVDTIIIGRGGGSMEDLWAFNNETLAREIYHSHIPIISAVGHETDFTICDFVSDLRAPTPSAAAELAVPDTKEVCRILEGRKLSLGHDVAALYQNRLQTLSVLRQKAVFSKPEYFTERKRDELSARAARLSALLSEQINRHKTHLSLCAARLEALSPLSVMARGYALVSDESGALIKSVRTLSAGQNISVRFTDGAVSAVIESKEEG